MISDEPDEDADARDDDTTLDILLNDVSVKPDEACLALDGNGWPQRSAQDIGLHVDTDTLAWFQANHADWRGEMRAVLHAWMIANAATRLALPPASTDDHR